MLPAPPAELPVGTPGSTPAPSPARGRAVAVLAVVALAGSLLWLVLMVAGGGPPESFDAAMSRLRLDTLWYATYLNVAFMVTVPVSMLMAALYDYCKPQLPAWAGLLAIVFVPVYCVLNLLVYLGQVTVVPALVGMSQRAEARETTDALLLLTLQALPGSAASFFNLLAYALLGIPSVIFGFALARRPVGWLRTAGALLMASAAGSVTALVGAVVDFDALRIGAVAGGGLFLLAMAALAIGSVAGDRHRR